MKLENLQPAEGSVRNNVRLGRGQGSGGGGTAKRGHKGAKSRSGYSQKRGFEGGQMPLQRRVPKFGFKNINRIDYKAINLDTIQALFDKTGVNKMDLVFLKDHGLIGKSDLVKVLNRGEITSGIVLKVHAFSKSAAESIEKAGGKALLLNDDTDINSIEVVLVAEKKEDSKIQAPKKAEEGDDLTKIEGIGPKIAELFIAAGVTTFQSLSESSVETLNEILAGGGSNFASKDPSTWAEQANLAASGNWDALKELQDKLNGGRPE